MLWPYAMVEVAAHALPGETQGRIDPRAWEQHRARQLGVLNFLPKPLQRKPLMDAVLRLLLPSGAVAEEENGFEGSIGGLSPAAFLKRHGRRGASSSASSERVPCSAWSGSASSAPA